MTFNRDTYQTKFVFNYLNTCFQFNIDGCASSKNALCDKFITAEIDFNSEDAFKVIPEKSRIFINPPYSKATLNG